MARFGRTVHFALPTQFNLRAQPAQESICSSPMTPGCKENTWLASSSSFHSIVRQSRLPCLDLDFRAQTKKAACCRPPFYSKAFFRTLQNLHVLCLPPFRAFDDSERN